MKSLSRSQTAFIGGSAALDAAGSTSVGMSAVLSAGTPCRLREGAIPVVRAPEEWMSAQGVDERLSRSVVRTRLAGVLRMGF